MSNGPLNQAFTWNCFHGFDSPIIFCIYLSILVGLQQATMIMINGTEGHTLMNDIPSAPLRHRSCLYVTFHALVYALCPHFWECDDTTCCAS